MAEPGFTIIWQAVLCNTTSPPQQLLERDAHADFAL